MLLRIAKIGYYFESAMNITFFFISMRYMKPWMIQITVFGGAYAPPFCAVQAFRRRYRLIGLLEITANQASGGF